MPRQICRRVRLQGWPTLEPQFNRHSLFIVDCFFGVFLGFGAGVPASSSSSASFTGSFSPYLSAQVKKTSLISIVQECNKQSV